MHVAVTGATGFVGSNTVPRLVKAGHRIRALVRPGRDVRELEAMHVEVCRGTMTDEAALRALVADVDVVVHTAYDPSGERDPSHLEYLRSNIFGSLALLELSRLAGVNQFICTVSTYILRRDVERPDDVKDTPLDERSPWASAWRTYVTHNVALESTCQAYGVQFDMNTTRFRCAWIYGVHPHLERSVWRDILEHVHKGGTYDSTFGCDVVAVQDVAAALAAAVGNPKSFGEVFNLSDMFVYNEKVARLAREVMGGSAQIVEHGMPKPPSISSEKVKALGVDVHRGMDGIREYFRELKSLLRGRDS